MPQTQLPAHAQPEIKQLHLVKPLATLARLASDPARAAFGQHLEGPYPADASAHRVERWHRIAQEGIETFNSVYRKDRLWPCKEFIYSWLSRKHAVLFDALSREEILPIDVLDAVVRDFSSCGDFSQLEILPVLTLIRSLKSMCLN